jgi:hypothetical protein
MPLASLAGLGEKLGTDLRIGQPVCCGLCREPFFSGAVGYVQICQRLAKGCHVWGLPAGSVRVVLVGFPLQGVHRFELQRLSDRSNCLFMAVFS